MSDGLEASELRASFCSGSRLAVSIPTLTPMRSEHVSALRLLVCALSLGFISAQQPVGIPSKDLPVDQKTVEMPAFRVKDDAICSFGISIRALTDRTTKKVVRLFISNVAPHSEAEKAEMKPGDEITALDGRTITQIDSDGKPGGELFRLLVNREPGEKIHLDYVTQEKRDVTLRAIVSRGF